MCPGQAGTATSGRGKPPSQPAVLAPESTARNGAQMTHNPAVPWAMNQRCQARQEARTAVRCPAWWGADGVSGHRPPSVAPGVDAVGSVGLAALEAAGPLAGQSVSAVGAPDDRPVPGSELAGPALAVEFDDHVGAQDGVLLVAADPLVQLGRDGRRAGSMPGLSATNIGPGSAWPAAAALVGRGDGALADSFGVASRHAKAVADDGFTPRRPGGPELSLRQANGVMES
jgi:hypothetical protein